MVGAPNKGGFAPGIKVTFLPHVTEEQARAVIAAVPGTAVESYYDPTKLASVTVPEGQESAICYLLMSYTGPGYGKVKHAERRVYLQMKG